MIEREIRVGLVGNPNVGKSTLFNSLTGMRQHTGNWPGKTVAVATGEHLRGDTKFVLTDLPGCYSLEPRSAEEEVTRDFIMSDEGEVFGAVLDSTILERSLILALQVISLCPRTVVVLNLADEGRRRGIAVDRDMLEDLLGVPVVCTSARDGTGVEEFLSAIESVRERDGERGTLMTPEAAALRARDIAGRCVTVTARDPRRTEQILDGIFLGKYTALPVLLLFLCGIMWLTVTGANYPSRVLEGVLTDLGEVLRGSLTSIGTPASVASCLVDGIYLVTARVVSVMLPPMAVFFPLFTLLEDFGYLPRVAFILDGAFRCGGGCGKQSLTMCMSLGCNAVGVTGCRIIDSPRERRIAVLTSGLVPCNGKFPGIICLISVFFAGSAGASALCLGLVILISVGMTLAVSRLLSSTICRGERSAYSLELPPYRIPRIGQVIVRSVLDRTLFVLGRAVSVAAPAGLVIWCLGNIPSGDGTLFSEMARLLDPAGRFLGMDGVILLAFLLGFPANEIVLPLMLMGYTCAGVMGDVSGTAEMGAVLTAAGWSPMTALSVIAFSLFHFPCSTTILTVRREWGLRNALLAALIPTLCGVALCLVLKLVGTLI